MFIVLEPLLGGDLRCGLFHHKHILEFLIIYFADIRFHSQIPFWFKNEWTTKKYEPIIIEFFYDISNYSCLFFCIAITVASREVCTIKLKMNERFFIDNQIFR